MEKTILFLTLVVLFARPLQAKSINTPSEAKSVAQELIQKTAVYYSTYPERAVSGCDWRSAVPTDPILVHAYPDLKPSYYVVPVVDPENQVVCLIGTSCRERMWHWYSCVQLQRYPVVSQDQAFQICQSAVDGAKMSEPKVVEMPDKKLYWSASVDDGARRVLVGLDDTSVVYTNQGADFPKSTSRQETIDIERPVSENAAEASGDENLSYPDFYNIEVPFHFQDSAWYCGEAALEIVFDYWGPDIGQDDIGDVADEVPHAGTNRTNLIRGSHFSWISTAIQNPMLHGYNQRPLGYCGSYQSWNRTSHYITRYEDIKTLISNDYPLLVLTWYSASHTAGHYRVVKGYDDNLDVFIVHDPWYTPPYSGPDVHFNQAFFVDDLWLLGDRWGLFSGPWLVEVAADSLVGQNQLFTVQAEFEYQGPHPFENQYVADSIQTTIVLPPDYQIVDPPSTTIFFAPRASGYTDTAVWLISAPPDSSGPDTIRVEVKGKITGSSNSYPEYQDWIGEMGEASLFTVAYLGGDANGDGVIDLGDAVHVLNYLFKNGPAPVPVAAGDANADGLIDLADVVYLLNYLFKGGPPPSC